jgi:NhaP-type Na+/H+ or K+/H+ antiporter
VTRLASLVGLVLAGFLVAVIAPIDGSWIDNVDGSSPYLYGTSLLLAVGLYGSTYGIDLPAARQDRRIILLAVTVGVVLKAVLIGGALALATRDPLFLLLGVAVAQIDPLSVAAIMGDERMSPRARTILAAWASFDDPLSLILAVYATAVATSTFGVGTPVAQGVHLGSGLVEVAADLAFNLLFAAVAYGLWRLVGARATQRPVTWAYALLAVLFAVAVWQFLMLGLAIVGLFLRPAGLAPLVSRLIGWALGASAVLLGMLLIGGVELGRGALLGVAAFLAQIVAALLLTRGLPRADRIHLALAQQNGITAIILALRLEAQFSGVVAVIAPAILVTNATYLAANAVADRRSAPMTGVRTDE